MCLYVISHSKSTTCFAIASKISKGKVILIYIWTIMRIEKFCLVSHGLENMLCHKAAACCLPPQFKIRCRQC